MWGIELIDSVWESVGDVIEFWPHLSTHRLVQYGKNVPSPLERKGWAGDVFGARKSVQLSKDKKNMLNEKTVTIQSLKLKTIFQTFAVLFTIIN